MKKPWKEHDRSFPMAPYIPELLGTGIEQIANIIDWMISMILIARRNRLFGFLSLSSRSETIIYTMMVEQLMESVPDTDAILIAIR
jgi:hypothetical protein